MNKLSILFASFIVALTANAQQTHQLGGQYDVYPDEETVWHKAPAGYKAVYLAHLGRHGSRYHSSAQRYDRLLGTLQKAEFAGTLTKDGKELLADVIKVSEGARGHYGALVPRGFDEHRHIMQRFCTRYPELFAGKDCIIDVYASEVPRCIMSMAASTDVIKEFNPKARFVRHCDESTQKELFSNELVFKARDNAEAFYAQNCQPGISSQPLLDRFFTDGGKFVKAQDREDFGLILVDFAAAAWEVGTDIWKYFSAEELAPFWKSVNRKYYYYWGPSEEFGEVCRDQAAPLLRHMLDGADKALATGEFRAGLRYGHDAQVVPLATLLGIEGFCCPATDGQDIDKVWKNYEVSPMAANIQMLFFRKGKDVLVKVMHNENEVRLSGIKTDCWPFYHWDDLRTALRDRIDNQPSFTRNGWQCDTLSEGLVYMRYSGYEKVSRAHQVISVAVVDLNNPRYSVDFTFVPGRNATSEAFKAAGAVVTMNAGYEKESVVIKTEGKLHYNILSDIVPYEGCVPQWKSDCAICTDGRRVSIEYTGKGKTIPQMREAYAAMQWPEIFSSSPMLIEKGVPVGKYFVQNNLSSEEMQEVNYEDPIRHQSVRHPRCAVALTADNRMILICVDGRRPGIAEGMNAWELTTFLETQFHPVDAINMDGGGSSAMCVKGHGHPETNVVSYPSKVPVFNHGTERRVPTHIHIIDAGK